MSAVPGYINTNNYYIYPMANSLRGGAIASETNIRALLGTLLSASCARSTNDFICSASGDNASASWYEPTVNDDTLNIKFDFNIGSGEGNCNGYYVNLKTDTNFKFEKNFNLDTDTPTNNKFTLYIYLRIDYSGTAICDGLSLWAGTQDEVNITLNEVAAWGFYDIGVLLGSISIDAVDSENVNCRYEYNNDITNCISIDRLGDANGSFVNQLYNKLNKLYKLMTDNGFMTVGTVLNNKAVESDGSYYKFNPEPGTIGYAHKDELISKNKIQMYIEPTIIPIENRPISGSTPTIDSQIVPNTISVLDSSDASVPVTYSEDNSIAYFNTNQINLFTGNITWVQSNNYKISYSHNKEGYYTGGLQYIEYNENDSSISNTSEILKFTSENITNNNSTISQITSIELFNGNSMFNQFGLTAASVVADQVCIADPSNTSDHIALEFTPPNILAVYHGLNYAEILCDSITTFHNITAQGTITGTKVYGAVWQ